MAKPKQKKVTRKPAEKLAPLPPAIVKRAEPALESEVMAQVVLAGNIDGLSAPQRVDYYRKFCEHLGLNPLTQPFTIITTKNGLQLYPNKSCTEQLKKKHGVQILDRKETKEEDMVTVTLAGRTRTGEVDSATGAVWWKGLVGQDRANALMKAETKARRRLVLALCGLGMYDDDEYVEYETAPDLPKLREPMPAQTGEVEAENKLAKAEKALDVELVPAPKTTADDELKVAQDELQDLFTQIVNGNRGLKRPYSKEELTAMRDVAAKSRGNINSLRDLHSAWTIESNERGKA